MQRRGQIQLSFGMIFSIIIVIATIAVAGYFIQKFYSTSQCVDLKLFYKSVQDEVDSVWRSPIAQNPLTISVPSGVEAVCFGNLSIGLPEKYKDLEKYVRVNSNFFLYPSKLKCSSVDSNTYIPHIHPETLVCAESVNGKISVILSKESSSEQYVKVRRA